MPRVSIGTRDLDDSARKMIAYALIETDREHLCRAMGCCGRTLAARKADPEMLTLRELRAIYRVGKLTDAQVLNAIREATHI